MRKYSERLSMEERLTVVNKFTERIANSGYSKIQANRVIISSLRGYEAAC